MVKLKWSVAAAPTGRYKSFENRGWPSAQYKDERQSAAVGIYCEDSYAPWCVKENNHRELTVRIADWSIEGPGFQWRTLKARFKTLDEAKAAAEAFLDKHPEFHPSTEAA